jgi:hypothetical protein
MTETTNKYAPFPEPPAVCSMPAYGLHVLQYILSTDDYVLGLLDDDALLAADHAAHIAVSAKGIEPRAVDVISAARMEILGVLVRRKAEAQPPAVSPAAVSPGDHDQPIGGSKVPVHPPKPTRPPAGQYLQRPQPAKMRF